MSQTQEIQNIDENEDELYEHHRFVIDKGQEKYRIDKYLTERIPSISRNRIQKCSGCAKYFSKRLACKI